MKLSTRPLQNFLRTFCLLCLSVTFTQPSPIRAANPALQPCTPSAALADIPVPLATVSALPTISPDLYIVTTVAPITNIVSNIGGTRVQVHGLIPEGADSHTFEPKPSAVEIITKADVVFLNGLHLEEPTRKLAVPNLKPGALLVELGTTTLRQEDWLFDFSFPVEKGDPNPHLWMNPLLTDGYAALIRDTLSKVDPPDAAYYQANYAAFSSRLTLLDQAICNAVATIPIGQRKLLTYHDSFAYFAPRYNMTVIGAIQPADFAEPSVQEVAHLIDQIRTEKVPAIFGSEVFPSKVIEQIGKETGVRYIDTLADDDLPNQTGDRTYHSYLQLMINDATTLTSALGGDPSALRAVPTANLHGVDSNVMATP